MKIDIENLLAERNLETARVHLKKLAAEATENIQDRNRIYEWIRRSGDFHLGVKFASKHGTDLDLLWQGRFLNLCGANEQALKCAYLSKASSPVACRIKAGIFISNFAYGEALNEALQAWESTPVHQRDYTARLGMTVALDALLGMGDLQQLDVLSEKLLEQTSEPMIRTLIYTTRARAALKKTDYEKLTQEIQAAENSIPVGENAIDRFSLNLLVAANQIIQGDRGAGEKTFYSAEEKIQQISQRREPLMILWRSMRRFGLLSEEKQSILDSFPWPQPTYRYFVDLPRVGEFNTRAKKLFVDQTRDEWSSYGQSNLGIPLELKALLVIQRFGSLGAPQERVKALLWPDDLDEYPLLESRLQQILRRLRQKYLVDARVEQGLISIKDADDIGFRFGRPNLAPSIFSQSNDISREMFASYYHLQKSRAHEWLNQLVAEGRIQMSKQGRTNVFSVQSQDRGVS